MKISSIVGDITINGELGCWALKTANELIEEGLEHITLSFTSANEATLPSITLQWQLPQIDMHSLWHPCSHQVRNIPADWSNPVESSLSSSAPLMQLRNLNNQSQLFFALSDAMRLVKIKTGVSEETNFIVCTVELFSIPEAPLSECEVVLRLDTRKLFYADNISQAVKWYESFEEYAPSTAPEAAFKPFYSTWYNFHQNLFSGELEEECKLGKEIGMEGIILDDGWQTSDNNRGYAFCGDWEISEMRFANMNEHVNNVHQTGLKYLVWYSVPFLGYKSKNIDRFKDMALCRIDRLDTYVLDPRFPEVRDFLISTYEEALRKWDIDGFKLDFIDRFNFVDDDPAIQEDYAGRDIKSLPMAVDRLLSETMSRLRAIKPEIMIEFRQSYIGPAIRKYGNIFRAGDCPADILSNRIHTIDLRLTSGSTAVHSDMLEWNYQDQPEVAALQFLNILFSVPQISVKLKDIPENHKRMLKFWIDFWTAHKNTLIKGYLKPLYPELNYPIVSAETEEETVTAVYNSGQSVNVNQKPGQKYYLINASGEDSLILELTNTPAKIESYNVFGESQTTEVIHAGASRCKISRSGFLVLYF